MQQVQRLQYEIGQLNVSITAMQKLKIKQEEKSKKESLHAIAENTRMRKEVDEMKADFAVSKEKIFMEHRNEVEAVRKKHQQDTA